MQKSQFIFKILILHIAFSICMVSCNKNRRSRIFATSLSPAGDQTNEQRRTNEQFNSSEIDARIGAMRTCDDFQLALNDLRDDAGIWHVQDNLRDVVISRFYSAWFNNNPRAALDSIRSIPNTDSGRLRKHALGEGIKFSSSMPKEFVDVSIELLPEVYSNHVIENVSKELFTKNPELLFDLIVNYFGQGRTKLTAMFTFFTLQTDNDFRRAVEYAQKLPFEEDRDTAFATISDPGRLPSQEDLDWALSAGMPKAEVDRLRKRMP